MGVPYFLGGFMKPIDIFVSMIGHALTLNADHAALAVVFGALGGDIVELPGDNSGIVEWMNDSVAVYGRVQRSIDLVS